MFDLIDILIAVYVTGLICGFAWIGAHKSNFVGALTRGDVLFMTILWPVFTVAVIPLAVIAIKEDN